MNGLQRWRQRWEMAGMATIPLWSNHKAPRCSGWDVRPPAEQWAEVGGDSFRGNIGALTGGPLGFTAIDCDNAQAVVNVQVGLAGMGLTPLAVQTPHDGRHFFVRILYAPKGVRIRLLDRNVGKGELRIRHQVVVPCSQIDGRAYTFLNGDPEAIPDLPLVQWRDLHWLVDISPPTIQSLEAPPVRLVKRGMPPKVEELLWHLRSARKGQSIGPYPSRSEAEIAVVEMLILRGWDYEAIQGIFDEWQPGHYREKGRLRDSYLRLTYRKGLSWLASSPERTQLAELYQQSQAWQWPGRNGALDWMSYQALLAIAWQCSSWMVAASLRDLAWYAATTVQSVSNALRRLQKRGLIRFRERGTVLQANVWEISTMSIDRHISQKRGYRGHIYAPHVSAPYVSNEVWTLGGLKRSDSLVYLALNDVPASAYELHRKTTKAPSTVLMALYSLAAYGLAEATAVNDRDRPTGWVRGPANLADVAEQLGASKASEVRRDQIEREREEYREHLELAKGGSGR